MLNFIKKDKLLIILIVIIASALRLWQIGNIPPSPDWDEAALGYNAYSIMQTGKDEYGKSFPIILRSFDDYKPALYTYFIIPFIKLFDLNIVSVRLPSAIFGILTVLATYFLVTELFKKWEMGNGKMVSLLTSFLLAISPWHIQFSRIAFEANVGLAFNVFAALFFLKSFKKPWFLVLAVLSGAASIYVYQSEKVFTPLLFFSLSIIFRKEIIALPKKYIFLSLLTLFLVLLPMINYMLINKEALARAQGVSIFSDQTPFLKENAKKLLEDRKNKDFLGLVFDNRRILYAKTIISGYLSHFSFNWLFIRGDLIRHHAPSMGIMYLFELPFLLIGIYKLFFSNLNKKAKYLIFSWFLIAPIPASITSGVPHAIRTLNFLPIFQILTAIGILVTFRKIGNLSSLSYLRNLIFSFFILFFIFNISYYLDQYFVQQNYFTSQDWQYGYKETVFEIKKIEDKYDKIIVTNKPYLDQSYMFFLFYLKYPPGTYQKEAQISSGGFRENHVFGKFEFRPIQWQKEEKNPRILYIGMPSDFPDGLKVIKVINFLDQKPAIEIVEG